MANEDQRKESSRPTTGKQKARITTSNQQQHWVAPTFDESKFENILNTPAARRTGEQNRYINAFPEQRLDYIMFRGEVSEDSKNFLAREIGSWIREWNANRNS